MTTEGPTPTPPTQSAASQEQTPITFNGVTRAEYLEYMKVRLSLGDSLARMVINKTLTEWAANHPLLRFEQSSDDVKIQAFEKARNDLIQSMREFPKIIMRNKRTGEVVDGKLKTSPIVQLPPGTKTL